MELVGDCALGLALYTQMWEATEKPGFKEAFPDFSGKHIDAARQRVLSNRNLMAIAARLNLGDYFIIEGYPPVHAENIRRGCKTGADVLEAVCAAIYLDAKDIAPVKAFLERSVEDNKIALYQPPARGRE
ncbi:MAG: hypothetical protein JO089_02305 [Alphaproteobacteria bacterium]|nr:hypothetical protein [Alphaproteobacteria bacterium]